MFFHSRFAAKQVFSHPVPSFGREYSRLSPSFAIPSWVASLCCFASSRLVATQHSEPAMQAEQAPGPELAPQEVAMLPPPQIQVAGGGDEAMRREDDVETTQSGDDRGGPIHELRTEFSTKALNKYTLCSILWSGLAFFSTSQ